MSNKVCPQHGRYWTLLCPEGKVHLGQPPERRLWWGMAHLHHVVAWWVERKVRNKTGLDFTCDGCMNELTKMSLRRAGLL